MQRRFAIAVWLISTVLLVVGNLDVEAQAARVSVTVEDAAGNPIEGVTVTITCPAKDDDEIVRVTNKKGKITVTHLDSLQTYRYQAEKEGFQSQVIQIQPTYTKTTRRTITLRPTERTELDAAKSAAASGGDRAITAFKEGAEAQQQGDFELAEKKFRLAAELSPNAAEPHIALAVVAHQRGDYAAAAVEAERALDISPNNEQALLLRHDAYRMLGDADKTAEAAEALRREGGIEVAAGTVFTEGMAEYRNGNTETAVQKFEEALELDPGMVNAQLMLGNIALIEGDAERASAMAAKALEVDPGNGNALKIRYDAARKLGDAAAERETLDALIEADPEWASTDLFNHAVELYNGDHMASAAAALERVVELRPDDAKARFLLGMAKYNLGDPAGAAEHLTRFLELAPDDPDAAVAREMLKYALQ